MSGTGLPTMAIVRRARRGRVAVGVLDPDLRCQFDGPGELPCWLAIEFLAVFADALMPK